MLTRINTKVTDFSGAMVNIEDAGFPAPFESGLEYSSPARGTWNIVHTGMLIPEAHEIFVCAAGCLRGVVLTAAEMGTAHRFSTIEIRENNLLEGTLEDMIIDGVSDILDRMEKKPPAVLVYTSCVHHFAGCDLDMVYRILGEKYPDVDFTDCYMNPIMRKSGMTPDQIMRRQLYSLLRPRPQKPKTSVILGNDLATEKSSELFELLGGAGYDVKEIHDCRTYEEYQKLAESSLYITYYPSAKIGGEELAERLDRRVIHIPMKFRYEDIEASLKILADEIGVEMPDYTKKTGECEEALKKALKIIGDKPIAIDYTAFPCPLSLARLLLSHGFNVKRIYADSFTPDEREDFEWLKANYPKLELFATVHAKMRYAAVPVSNEYLAIGQKAAHFTGTNHFVNIVQGGGLWGHSAVIALCGLMTEAFSEEKDMECLVQIKGWGCGCCL